MRESQTITTTRAGKGSKGTSALAENRKPVGEVFARVKERWGLNSEVMKHITRGFAFLLVALATPVLFGGEPNRGVGGVDVIVKQRPSDHAVTDGGGNFAIEALAAGSYTLTFRARKAEDITQTTRDKVIVATMYSLKIEGTKQAVKKSGLTTNDLLAGYDVEVQVGPGGRIHGQVAAGAAKNMIWIPKEPGSNVPGHWVEEGSVEAKAATHRQAYRLSVEGVREIQR